MPPIRIEVAKTNAPDAPRVFHSDVEAGRTVIMVDHSPQGDSMLAVSCDSLDIGGQVTRHAPEDTHLSANHAHRIINPQGGNLVKKINYGEHDVTVGVVTRLGSVTMFLTHVPGN